MLELGNARHLGKHELEHERRPFSDIHDGTNKPSIDQTSME
jgi:hypothetical protein